MSDDDTSLAVAEASQQRDEKPAQSAVLRRSAIVPSKTNPRTHFDPEYLKDLGASIKEHNVIQPLLVRPLPASRLQETFESTKKGEPRPTHEIVCGECRWRASGPELGNQEELPVLIRHLTDIQVLQIQLVENLKRRDLHPLEEAEGFERLVNDHKLTIEDIAARMGKSISYVYKVMKLLELTPECREILYQGKLTQSTALLVARAPAYLQKQIATDIMGGGAGDEPMSFRQAQDMVHRRYMLRLSDAVFDIKDASLVGKAGACTTCTKNTGSNKDLFGDVSGGASCTDPKCFDGKKVAHMDAVAKAAKAQGKEVIQGKEAKELYPYEHSAPKGYTRLDDSQYINGVYQPLRKALGKDLPATTLVQNPFTKQLEEVLPNAVANKLLKQVTADKKAKAAVKKKDAEPTKEELANALATRFEDRSCSALHAAIMAGKTPGITVALAREIAKHYAEGLYGDRANRFASMFNLNAAKVATSAGIEDFLDNCAESLVGPALLMLIAEGDLEAHSFDKKAPVFELIAEEAGVDLDAILDSVKADMKAEAAERKAAVKAPEPIKTKAKKTTAAAAKAGINAELKKTDPYAVGNKVTVRAGVTPSKKHLVGKTGEIRAVNDKQKTLHVAFGMGLPIWLDRTDVAVEVHSDDAPMPLKNGKTFDPAAAWPFPTASKA